MGGNRARFLSLLLALSLIFSACTPFNTTPDSSPGNLVIYSGRSEELIGQVIDQFSEATGIQVDVRYGGTAELAATISEEGQNSPADIFYAQDPGGMGAVSAAGLLAPLPEDILSTVSQRVRSSQGLWVGVSGRVRVVVYNTEELTPEELPADLGGFTGPRWKGRIGWAPTNGSFQAMVTAMRRLWGDAETRAWLEGIQANDPIVYDGNMPIVAAVAAGEIQVGFVNHYYLYRFLQEEGDSFPARNLYLSGGGPGSLVMVSGVGRLASAKNVENAHKFIEFLLSPVTQQYFASQTFEYPLVEGVQVHRDLVSLDELQAPEISLEDLADLEGTLDLLRDAGVLP